MNTSLSKQEIFSYIRDLLKYNFPDNNNISDSSLKIMVNAGLDRLEYSFSNVKDKYFCENDIPLFNHLNSDHMVVLLYYIANSGFKLDYISLYRDFFYLLRKYPKFIRPFIRFTAKFLSLILGGEKKIGYFMCISISK